jgi:prepilin-type N-terminal cleavage/methylation domain-containing protein
MTLTHRSHRPRQGYTLIELLVVIAILGILMGMLMVAIFPSLFRGKDLQARSDISQMQADLELFKSKHEVGYVPSRLVLWENKLYAPTTQVEFESAAYLKDVFKANPFAPRNPANPTDPTDFNDWDGNGVMNPQPVTLEGHQVLVFLLGGIPANGQVGCLGFNANGRTPTAPGGTRKGPYFEFRTNRLVRQSNGFLAYQDPYGTGQVYAFFSSYKRDNGYNRYAQLPFPSNPTVVPTSDCQSLGVWPYLSGNNVYQNPKTFQIICAGKDGRFGPGNAVFGLNSPVTGAGADDLSNFHDKKLGAP